MKKLMIIAALMAGTTASANENETEFVVTFGLNQLVKNCTIGVMAEFPEVRPGSKAHQDIAIACAENLTDILTENAIANARIRFEWMVAK